MMRTSKGAPVNEVGTGPFDELETDTVVRPSKVSIRDLSIVYTSRRGASVRALESFSVDVYEREFISIVGPSGCGKTSLLRAIAGLETPTSGELTMNGAPITGPGHDRGVAFQSYALFPWMTLQQNVEFGPKMRGMKKKERRERAARFIDAVGLKGFESRYPQQLSGGMQQRGSLARLYANDPELLLMDEPFAAVDEQTRELLQEDLLRTRESINTTVILITHSIEEAVFLSDRIVVMSPSPGRIKAVVDNPLNHPRQFETRGSERFHDLTHRIATLIREPQRS